MLSPQQIDDFNENGYLAVDGLLDYDLDIAPVIAEYQQLLDKLCAQWVADGRLPEAYSHLPFERRLVEVYKAGLDYAQAIDIALPNAKVYADTPINVGPAVFDLLRSPRMLSAVESLIGGVFHPPQCASSAQNIVGGQTTTTRVGKRCGTRVSACLIRDAKIGAVNGWVGGLSATGEMAACQVGPKTSPGPSCTLSHIRNS